MDMADELRLQSLNVGSKLFGRTLAELLKLALLGPRPVSTSLGGKRGFGSVEVFVAELSREAVSALDRVEDLLVEVVVDPAKSVDLRIKSEV